jgi:hypothetical protein
MVKKISVTAIVVTFGFVDMLNACIMAKKISSRQQLVQDHSIPWLQRLKPLTLRKR